MSAQNKIFCTAPFTTLRVESYSNHEGFIFKPGCVYKAQGPIPTLADYQSGLEMVEHRNNLLTGTVPSKGCYMCSKPESQGLPSVRLDLLKKPWASAEEKIFMLDMFFGNTCNLGCIMCGPEWSSYISNERFNAGIIPTQIKLKDNTQIMIDTLDKLPDLKTVSFIGGEFFVVKRNLEILDLIIGRGLECSIATNATVINDDIIDRLKQIKNIEIRISVDGTKDCYEFIRYPAKWEILNNNMARLKKALPNSAFLISAVVQPLNVQNLHELFEWANKQYIKTILQYISTPLKLCWPILTDLERQDLVDLLTKKQSQGFKITQQQYNDLNNLIIAIQETNFDSEVRQDCIKFIGKLMSYRKIHPTVIEKHFGILTTLAEEIINENSNNHNPRRS
jgi:MoaA/NifB/PqqE/SkfB family radical SAM enzyme